MSRSIRFGPFLFDRQTEALYKDTVRIKLQSKPRQILIALLERPGEPISRQELKERLWPKDTLIDFENGLNTAANRLRFALGDSAEEPMYIETQTRSGYRFIGEIVEDVESHAPRRHRFRWSIPVALFAVIAAGAAWILLPHGGPLPQFTQLTFRRGPIEGARFAMGGHTILYSSQFEAEPWRIYETNLASRETRTLGFDGSLLSSVSRSDELSLISWEQVYTLAGGNLATVPLNGGSPRGLSRRVTFSDWSPDAKSLAVVRFNGGNSQLEYPLGTVRYTAAGLLSWVRVSRDGSQVAFFEHPVRNDDGGDVKLLDHSGKVRTLAAGWKSAGGLAWSSRGDEVWFTAARTGARKALWAVTPSGKVSLLWQGPGSLALQDVSEEGRVLVAMEDRRVEMAGKGAGMAAERDLSWFDWSQAEGISPDGSLMLFDETGDGGGPNGVTYAWNANTGSVVRLGEGLALSVAPDRRSALVLDVRDRRHLNVVPIGVGQPRQLSGEGIEYHGARFFPDGRRIVAVGNEAGEPVRLYVQPVSGGKPRPLASETFLGTIAISPDGTRIAGADRDHRLVVISVDSGDQNVIPVSCPILVAGWSADGRTVLVRDVNGVSAHLYRVNLASGQSTPWREIGPHNTTGVLGILRLFFAPDETSYVYSYYRAIAQLYVTDPWVR